MKGKYHIIIQNNKIKFEFDIKRNLTIIRGDSATGKTTLINMIETYERLGDESGISVSCDRKCLTLNNSNWENVIRDNHNCIIFTDEENKIIKSLDFAKAIKDSDNYYVLITRENLPYLPYSVEEVYGIHSSGRYSDLQKTYNSFYRLYTYNNVLPQAKAEIVIVEDSNSGYDFFSNVIAEPINCISAKGKSNIKALVEDNYGKHILVIADGAAFGSEMNELYLYTKNDPHLFLYLPESFEWVILSSGLIDGNRIASILEHTEDFVESAECFSWEQYYTKLLIRETDGTYLKYSKHQLNKNFLNPKEKDAVLRVSNVIKDAIQ